MDVYSKQSGAFVIITTQPRKVSKFSRDQSSPWKQQSQQLDWSPVNNFFLHKYEENNFNDFFSALEICPTLQKDFVNKNRTYEIFIHRNCLKYAL